MKVLVTGGTGFLGTTLCAALRARGDDVTPLSSKSCDLTRAESLHAFDGTRYDRIFHLAAWTQAGDFCLRHPGEQWIINQQINTHVLAWWKERQPQAKLIGMGTSCAYPVGLPHIEDNYHTGTPLADLFTYAMTKRMLHAGMLALSKQFGLEYLCLVPSTLYGPGYHLDGRQMHFIFDLIRKILAGKERGEPVVLWGDGHQRRELVSVRDFVRIALALDARCKNDLINIGAGEEYSIRDFAGVICKIVGYDPALIQYDTSRYTGAKSKVLDVTKLRVALGADPALTKLEDGLAETVKWMREARGA